MYQQHSSKKIPPVTSDSIIESLRDITSGVGKTVTNDIAGRIPQDALSALLGLSPKSGELRPNQAVDFAREKQTDNRFYRPEILHRRPVKAVEKDLEQKIQSVRQELAALSQAVKSLNTDIQKAIQEQPVDPGIYHLNYFERIKSILRMLRENIEDSRTWLATWSTCKKKRSYWGMYKKHGNYFGLSNERSLATSAG